MSHETYRVEVRSGRVPVQAAEILFGRKRMSNRLEGEKSNPAAYGNDAGAAGPRPPAELDADALQRLHSLDPTGKNRLIARVVDAFSASSARMLPQLREAAHGGDLKLVRLIVHTLKSSSANVGAIRLSQLCADLELQLRQGRVGGITQAAGEILAEVAAVDDALRRLPTGPG